MTPKEKSWQLIIKFQMKPSNLTKEDAKKSALIAVDEIINHTPEYIGIIKSIGLDRFKNHKYWEEVKQELEKL